MADKYPFKKIEEKWQKIWSEKGIYKVSEDLKKPKKYVLEMFPYPSGKIHMGHVRNYSIGDLIARYSRMKGFNVLYPMGYDAFGLPAENAAIKHGVPPKKWTYSNIETMRLQLKQLGNSYDWDREITTSNPDYYRWGQWLFLKLYEKGIAYRKKAKVNWCPTCKTVLANEQVETGLCWRCQFEVQTKELDQWFFKITAYAEELLDDIEKLKGWPERVKIMQRNWIGRSQGAFVDFTLKESTEKVRVFTTRPDTLYGATFFLLAPEHSLVEKITAPEQKKAVSHFLEKVAKETDIDRTSAQIPKQGVFTGSYIINPLTGKEIPIWLADYVLMEYGTGAVMAVPAHDQRDFEFAKKYGLEIKIVIEPEGEKIDPSKVSEAYIGEGKMVNSGSFDGAFGLDGVKKVTKHLQEKGIGEFAINYRLRDWLISRQRYWGNPIPMVYCDDCGLQPIPYEDLPVILPDEVKIKGIAGSSLAAVDEFINTTCPCCKGKAKRETDTMDTFVDSSWYFLRFCSPKDDKAPFSSFAANYWMSVDQYIGGIEHAILHLMYARFFTKVIRDLGLIEIDEPFSNLLTQGMVIKDGAKMSKSRGNTVEPTEITKKYGADTMRVFILFASPPVKDLDYSDEGVEGSFRFLNRVWRVLNEILAGLGKATNSEPDKLDKDLRRKTHFTIKKVTDDIERFNFNTAISAIMEMVNSLVKYLDAKEANQRNKSVIKEAFQNIVLLLCPFAPHVAEELWHLFGQTESIHLQKWPVYDEKLAKAEEVTLVVQVNGKVRDRITVESGVDEEKMKEIALASKKTKSYTEGKQIVKVITVPQKLVNIVVR